MTYCVAARVDEGLVFLADSRVTAGFDHVSTARKLHVFERRGDRAMVLLLAGNLGLCQAILNVLASESSEDPHSIWCVSKMYDAAHRIGQAVRLVFDDHAAAMRAQGLAFNVEMILGGQIGAGKSALFQIYPAGNFIEATPDNPYLEIGSARVATPLLKQLLFGDSSLSHATKCALLAMDWTLRTNLSVGPPLDLVVYQSGALLIDQYVNIKESDHSFRGLGESWRQALNYALRQVGDPIQWIVHGICKPLTPAGLPLRIGPENEGFQRVGQEKVAGEDSPPFGSGERSS